MEPIRPSSSGYFPEVSDELGREAGSPYPSQEALPAASYSETPVSAVAQLSQSPPPTYLRAGHYTVVAARPGELVHHVQEGDKDGEAAFCVQAVGPFTEGAAELDKAVPHELQFISPELSGATSYQLSAAGDVYKLVVRETKVEDEDQLAAQYGHHHHHHQLLPEPLHQEAAGSETAPPELHDTKKVVLALPPSPAVPPPPPPPPPPPHCLICDMRMTSLTVLDIFSNTTHQTSTTYAIKLRQVTGHRANFTYHSEVLCESCASLLNVVDSFEARLREIKARLEDTRAEVQNKFSRTCARYDEAQVHASAAAEDVESPKTRGKKRRTDEPAPQPKKKARGKTAAAAKDTTYRDKSKTTAPDEVTAAAGGRRRRPVRRVVERSRALVEGGDGDPEELDDPPPDPDDPIDPSYLELADTVKLEGGAAVAAAATASAAEAEAEEEEDEDGEDDADDGEDGEEDTSELADGRPIRVANMCGDCGRLFINPMVMRVHQLAHQEQQQRQQQQQQQPPPGVGDPAPPAPPTEDLMIPVLEMEYGTGPDDVLAQAVQQMHGPPDSPPPPPPMAEQPAAEPGGPPEAAAAAADGQSTKGIQDVYKCDSCMAMFKTLQRLQRHHRKMHTQAVWRCFVCWQAVDSLRRMKRHVATHGERNSCAVCLAPFETKMHLKLHVTRKHPETQTKNNYCELCDKHFDNQGFIEHARGVHGVGGDASRRFKCEQCDKVLPNSVCYVRHMKVHKKDFNCQYCGKSFNNRTNLTNHERTHTGEKPYFCPDCERSFTSKQARDIHIRTFHRQNPYACKRCSRRCESKAAFIRHMRSHAGVTPFECPVCGKKMTTEYSLKMHIRAIHDRKLPFKCDVCQKAFPYKSSLTLHMNTHSGDKSHICDICGKCFASRGSLRTHMHTHSTEKPYKCEWCDRSFSRKDLLAGHKLQIHGIKPEMNYSRLSRH